MVAPPDAFSSDAERRENEQTTLDRGEPSNDEKIGVVTVSSLGELKGLLCFDDDNYEFCLRYIKYVTGLETSDEFRGDHFTGAP